MRDIYEVGDRLLIVATDRLSAFDVVFPTPIPDKGRVLTQLSMFWFEKLAAVIPNHVISATNFDGELAPYAAALEGRAMLVRRTEPRSDRMRGARIYLRFRLEGLSEDGRDLRHSASRRPARIGPAAQSDLYAFDESDHRPRRKYLVRGNRRADRPAARGTIARYRA